MRYFLFLLIGVGLGWFLHGEFLLFKEEPTVEVAQKVFPSPQVKPPPSNENTVFLPPIQSADKPLTQKKSIVEQLAYLYEQYYLVNQDASTVQIKMKIDELVRSRVASLKRENRTSEIIELMEFLLIQDSGNALYYYELAQAQHALQLNQHALSSLGFILYDPNYGKQAQALTNKITRQLELARKVQAPLERHGEHFIVNAEIVGRGPIRLLIDTGASITTLSPQAIERLGLSGANAQRLIRMNTAGGQIEAPLLRVDGLSVMGMSIPNIDIGVVQLSGLAQVDGLLGMNYLRNFDFNLDQRDSVLYLDGRQ